jgi:hypothetical protein
MTNYKSTYAPPAYDKNHDQVFDNYEKKNIDQNFRSAKILTGSTGYVYPQHSAAPDTKLHFNNYGDITNVDKLIKSTTQRITPQGPYYKNHIVPGSGMMNFTRGSNSETQNELVRGLYGSEYYIKPADRVMNSEYKFKQLKDSYIDKATVHNIDDFPVHWISKFN